MDGGVRLPWRYARYCYRAPKKYVYGGTCGIAGHLREQRKGPLALY
jgi:hypothetical protein